MIPLCEKNKDTGWIDMELQNEWTNYGQYFNKAQLRKIGKQVYLRGLIKNGTLRNLLCQLPNTFRPQDANIYVAKAESGYVEVRIHANGEIFIQNSENR